MRRLWNIQAIVIRLLLICLFTESWFGVYTLSFRKNFLVEQAIYNAISFMYPVLCIHQIITDSCVFYFKFNPYVSVLCMSFNKLG